MLGVFALSSLELDALSAKVELELRSYYVNNVYSISKDSFLLRMHRGEMPEKSVVISTKFGVWPTDQPVPRGETTDFVSKVREFVIRSQLLGCSVPEGERVVQLNFSRRDTIVRGYVEVFGAGNVVLTDGEGVIHALLREVPARGLVQGGKYDFPPSRGIPVSKLVPADVRPLLARGSSPGERSRSVVALPSRLVQEAVHRVTVTSSPVSTEELDNLAAKVVDELKKMRNEARSTERFYVYRTPDGGRFLSAIRLGHIESELEKMMDWGQLQSELVNELIEQYRSEAASGLEAQIRKEQRRIENAKETLKRTVERANSLEKVASDLKQGISDLDSVADQINQLSSDIKWNDGYWTLKGVKAEFGSPFSLASKLFDEAKLLRASTKNLERSISEMESNLELLKKKSESEATPKVASTRVRRRFWFEAYRWFVTSEGLLSVGGRDAGSNSLLIRKRLEPYDLVFHTEAPGSPFFILKHGSKAGNDSLLQVAQATVSFSRAWKEGLSAADAYCVAPEQVKLGAPSGMYMPRGSFMVEGERRYFKGVKLRLGVGLSRVGEDLIPCSGPVEAVSRYCYVVVEVTPGHLAPGATAAKIRNILVQHLDKDGGVELNLDELARCLPPGKSAPGRIMKGEGKPFKEDLFVG
jgi:predicted ribosome quality control (RQC) complex YloA/Tae2 family protein